MPIRRPSRRLSSAYSGEGNPGNSSSKSIDARSSTSGEWRPSSSRNSIDFKKSEQKAGNQLLSLEDNSDEEDDPWDEETEEEQVRLKEETEAVGIAASIKSGKKPVSSKLRLKEGLSRGKSLKKWFNEVVS
jgi:hypothetical protein